MQTNSQTSPRIDFERVERACGHNEKLRANGEKRGIIYDFNVLLDGEHRAVFKACVHKRGYWLHDPDGGPIAPFSWRPHLGKEVEKQGYFLAAIEDALSNDAIPTHAQLAAIRDAKARETADLAAAEQDRRRQAAIRDAAPDLLEAARMARPVIEALIALNGPDAGGFGLMSINALDAAIAKAERALPAA